MTIQATTEFAATAPEVIDQIASELSTSDLKLRIFEAIYSGGKAPKTAERIADKTGLTAQRVLALATPMSNKHYFGKTKVDNLVAYTKYGHINASKEKILRLARNPKALEKHVTVRKPRVVGSRPGPTRITIEIDKSKPHIQLDARHITIDDIDNFKDVRSIRASDLPLLTPVRLPERQFKYGTANILGEKGVFTDWGGEKNDLYSTQVTVAGKKSLAAIAFKGPATQPPLTPKKLGKNGDQIARLFSSSAQIFLVQFEGQVDESVFAMMRTYAVQKSVETGETIYYGVVAFEDSHRLRVAYEAEFDAAATMLPNLRNIKY